ncbi:MAG: hypothetical protein K8R41_05055 [Bacteroidales bacterium]|nr:hypothetical protein [Bacteroidales bacterium]
MLKVHKNVLILIAGIIWFTASIILSTRAISWIELMTSTQLVIGIIAALLLSIIKIYFIFKKLTLNNIKRIQSFTQANISIWEFHIMKDKLLIVLMIIIGIGLRSAPFIPKYVLFPIYLGIGLAMLYSAILYIVALRKV